MSMSLATPRRFNPYLLLCLATLALAIFAIRSYGQPDSTKPAPTGVDNIQLDAQALLPTLKSDLARSYAAATTHLPRIEPRTLYRHKTTRAWISEFDHKMVLDDDLPNYTQRSLDETFYYYTGYGSPLAYSRAFEVLAAAGISTFKNIRTLDYGCGGIAPMRLQAHCGADAVGVDIDLLFPLLYNQPGDTGPITTGDLTGKISLVTGRWPADDAVNKSVGGNYDLIISKNTLKKGYVSPEKPCEERFLVKLGVADVNFCKAMFDALKPGGKVIIYNISGKQSADKYLPMADGRCPFPKEMLETVGFKVLSLDTDDSEACRAMAHILGWDQGQNAMNLKDDLFAMYTLLERPR